LSIPVLIGVLVLALALAARAGTRNTYVKRKLVLSVALAIGYLAAHLMSLWPGTPPGIARTLGTIEPVLLVLAASNLIVLLAVNPFRQDRLPAHLPAILQDAITVAVFITVVVLFFNDRLQLTAAAGAVVLGLALQDTLGNAIAGLALQADQPYKVGDWIRVGDHEGRVTQISWRSTVLRTRESTLVALPNSSIADGPIVNYSEPAPPTRIWIDVGVSYTTPPNHVKAVIAEAFTHVPLAMATPAPDVLVLEFANSAIVYRARCYVQDMERSSLAQDQIRTAIWYTFQRRGLDIPYPIQVEYSPGTMPSVAYPEQADLPALIGNSALLGGLAPEARARLAGSAQPRLFGAGDVIVRQGDVGRTSFLVARGEVRVSLRSDDQEVARLGVGEMFGEMSWLTGEPRSATVTAIVDTLAFELDDTVLRELASTSPGVLDTLAEAVSRRRHQLESITADTAQRQLLQQAEPRASLVARMKRFLRLR
jgi:small-conductance mechanosensitive channel/CRP-like cAMP-binding protein